MTRRCMFALRMEGFEGLAAMRHSTAWCNAVSRDPSDLGFNDKRPQAIDSCSICRARTKEDARGRKI